MTIFETIRTALESLAENKLRTMLTMLGVIGEYVGSLVVTANRRPQSVVREIVRPAADAREPERAP